MRRSRVLALSFASKHLPFEHNYKTEGRRRKEESKMEDCMSPIVSQYAAKPEPQHGSS